jgi:probable addiction module antidote protein
MKHDQSPALPNNLIGRDGNDIHGAAYTACTTQNGAVAAIRTALCGRSGTMHRPHGALIMALKTTRFDSVDYLDSDEAISAYVEGALETGDPAFITQALGTVARVRGMSQIAKQTGLSRESLYKALSAEGHPEFSSGSPCHAGARAANFGRRDRPTLMQPTQP